MATYLLTWNPTKFRWDEYSDDLLAVELGFDTEIRWSCGVRKSLPIRSRIFMMRLGYRQPLHGIFASGYAISEPYADIHWDAEAIESNAQYVDFEADVMLDMDVYPLLNPEAEVSSHFNWKPQSSGVEIPQEAAMILEEKWAQHLTSLKLSPARVVEQSESIETYAEGKQSKITVNRYERDPKARQKCLDHYGTVCHVCNFDFGLIYGEIGEGFIHVHHLNSIASQGGTFQLDPIRDLRPVCPNCHAMLHRETPAMKIEDLRKVIGR